MQQKERHKYYQEKKTALGLLRTVLEQNPVDERPFGRN